MVFSRRRYKNCSKAKEITKISRTAGLKVIKEHLSHSLGLGIKCHVAINYLGYKSKACVFFSTIGVLIIMKARFNNNIATKSLQNTHRINISREGISDISSTE